MCRHVAEQFPPEPASAGAARALVAGQLDRWELDDPDGSIVLLVSELVTNAVRHAGTPVELTMAVAEGTVEIGVADSDPRIVSHLRPDQRGETDRTIAWQSESGRGLFLVDVLAEEWGTEHFSAGKQVWFRMSAGEHWPYRTECPCHGAELHDAVQLGSGRHVVNVPDPPPRRPDAI